MPIDTGDPDYREPSDSEAAENDVTETREQRDRNLAEIYHRALLRRSMYPNEP